MSEHEERGGYGFCRGWKSSESTVVLQCWIVGVKNKQEKGANGAFHLTMPPGVACPNGELQKKRRHRVGEMLSRVCAMECIFSRYKKETPAHTHAEQSQ